VTVRVEEAPFEPGAETNRFLRDADGAGAAVTFTGLVRSSPGDEVASLTLEAYPELAIAQIEKAVAEAISRFGLIRAAVIHRYGTLTPGRADRAGDGARRAPAGGLRGRRIPDYGLLKTDAPFWKKEATAEGARWVEAKPADDAARDRWRT